MEDSNARITVFAPVNDVFLYNPDLRAMDQKETLSHIGRKFVGCGTEINAIFSGHTNLRNFEWKAMGEADDDSEHNR